MEEKKKERQTAMPHHIHGHYSVTSQATMHVLGVWEDVSLCEETHTFMQKNKKKHSASTEISSEIFELVTFVLQGNTTLNQLITVRLLIHMENTVGQ